MALKRRRERNGISSSAGSAGVSAAATIASRVAFRAPADAANRPNAWRSAGSSTPAAGTNETTRSRGSVSVPVLSMQSVSTEASDSIAFSCCASAPARAIRSAAAAYVIETSRMSPSGTSVTMPATDVSTA